MELDTAKSNALWGWLKEQPEKFSDSHRLRVIIVEHPDYPSLIRERVDLRRGNEFSASDWRSWFRMIRAESKGGTALYDQLTKIHNYTPEGVTVEMLAAKTDLIRTVKTSVSRYEKALALQLQIEACSRTTSA